MKIKLVQNVNREEFKALYRDAGWWFDEYDGDTSFIEGIVGGSFLFAAAFSPDGKMIGMGRVLSDGCSDAYIQDVVVLKDFRGKGTGGQIITFLISELKERGIDWIGLIGEPGTENFYTRIGFRKLEKHIPMKLETPAGTQ